MTRTADREAPFSGVSQTALWTAAMRAAESARADGLFTDPWAEQFIETAGSPAPFPGTELMRKVLPDWLAVRTRYFDDYLLAAARTGCRQAVILGAGLDTRALRLDWPEGMCVYEVDLPAVHDFKDRVLGSGPDAPDSGGDASRAPAQHEPARRIPVRADLCGPWAQALTAAGLDPSKPTAWLCEGLLFYLADTEVSALVAALTRLSAPGSTLGVECLNGDRTQSPLMRDWLAGLAEGGTPWRWRITEPERWWAAEGWDARPADLLTLPYAVRRFSAYPQFQDGPEKDSVLMITGQLSTTPSAPETPAAPGSGSGSGSTPASEGR